jgi:uncharacterized protein YjiS (DUF1127 family)
MRLMHVSGVASAHHLWPQRPYVLPAQRFCRPAIGARPDRAAQIESIMNPRHTQEQIGLFPAATEAPSAAQIERIIAEAAQARDEALAGSLRRTFARIGQALAAVGNALLTWPLRRATYDKLRRMSDRELEDIGLTRGDVARVFEPDFQMPATPANTNTGRIQAA